MYLINNIQHISHFINQFFAYFAISPPKSPDTTPPHTRPKASHRSLFSAELLEPEHELLRRLPGVSSMSETRTRSLRVLDAYADVSFLCLHGQIGRAHV